MGINFTTLFATLKNYYNALEPQIAETPLHSHYLALRQFKAALKKNLRFATGVMLDVGSGNRPYDKLFQPHVKRIISLDYLEDTRNLMGKTAAIDVVATGTALPFGDKSLDTVTNFFVIEHLPNPEHLLAELSRVLKAGGVLFLGTPIHHKIHSAPYDYYRITPFAYKSLLNKYNLSIEQLAPCGYTWATIALFINTWLRRDLFVDISWTGNNLDINSKGYPLRLIISIPFIVMATVAVNLVALVLDALGRNPEGSPNYLIICRKNRD